MNRRIFLLVPTAHTRDQDLSNTLQAIQELTRGRKRLDLLMVEQSTPVREYYARAVELLGEADYFAFFGKHECNLIGLLCPLVRPTQTIVHLVRNFESGHWETRKMDGYFESAGAPKSVTLYYDGVHPGEQARSILNELANLIGSGMFWEARPAMAPIERAPSN